MISDIAVYVDGRRVEPRSLDETYDVCRAHRGIAWITLSRPTYEELASVAHEFELHPLVVEDIIKGGQRPKFERYDKGLFVVLRPARYVDESEAVDIGEVHVFAGPDFVIEVLHGEPSPRGEVRRRLEGQPELLRKGPMAILYAITDWVVDNYAPVAEGLEEDVYEIESEVFAGRPDATRRTYELSRQVIVFDRAAKPLTAALERLIEEDAQGADVEIRRYLRDVHDHLLRVTAQVDSLRQLLSSIIGVNLALLAIGQNNQTKKISAWAAILAVPTIVAGIYGMNFRYMPELRWIFGYPYALGLMALVSVALYLIFKRAGWL